MYQDKEELCASGKVQCFSSHHLERQALHMTCVVITWSHRCLLSWGTDLYTAVWAIWDAFTAQTRPSFEQLISS